MEIQIRPAKPEQAQVLSQIALAAKRHWGYPERWIEIWKPQLTFSLADLAENESWVAELNDTPIAFYRLLERDGSAWMDDLWVDPGHIGKGVGKGLFLHAMERCRQRGLKTVRLEADPHAVGFYEKMGMYTVAERQSEVDGQPRYLPIMEIKLEL